MDGFWNTPEGIARLNQLARRMRDAGVPPMMRKGKPHYRLRTSSGERLIEVSLDEPDPTGPTPGASR